MITFIFVTNQLLKMRRDVFQAIADPVRREIIELLAKEKLTVNAVAERFDISRPAISKHIRILNECRIVEVHQVGRERFCSIEAKSLIPAFLWIDQYRTLWEQRLDQFEAYLNEFQSKKNKEHE